MVIGGEPSCQGLVPRQPSWFQFYQSKICQEDNLVRVPVGKHGSLNL